ncbi:MAG: PAAR-like protein [Chryseobacterium jejuense]|uniref:PAAR-like protein n=1 Tax=Chryseobacterium jejuense TaxID=445960 RepID=UPI003D0CEED2
MGQLYVPDGTWTLCSNGKKILKIQVTSQATVKIEGGKLAATEKDRFDGNFVCPPMMAAGALVGAVLAGALVASGPALVVFAAGFAGAVGGGTVLANHLPSVCSLLCRSNEWTALHPKVKLEKKRALLENATLTCMFGGLVTLKMPNYQESIDMGLLAGVQVYRERGGDDDYKELTPKEQARLADYDTLTPKQIKTLGLNPNLFGEDGDSGYHAELYRNKKTGTYVVAFRGTQSGKDTLEDGLQGTGISSEYYNKAADLAKKMKDNPRFSAQNTIFTGHSLGGGMAATAGGASGFPTYTYNAAGVHDATLKRNQVYRKDMNHVQAYNSDNDILNAVQDSREGVLKTLGFVGKLVGKTKGLPRAAGERMELETDNMVMQGKSFGHAAINAVKALEREAAAAASRTVKAKTQ